MTHPWKFVVASATAVGLAACGGGGGSGGGVASTPPAPVNPGPAPAPVNPGPGPAPGQVSVPARATTGAGPTAQFATDVGSNFTTGSTAGKTFPLLQSAMTWNGTRVEADAGRNAAGGSATVQSGALKVSGADGLRAVTDNLDWTRAGQWDLATDWFVEPGATGAFVVGYQTPVNRVPTTGTATYTGHAAGTAFDPKGGDVAGIVLTGGNASLTADFGARSVSGSVTGLSAEGVAWNNFAFTSSLSGGDFSGSTNVTNAPVGTASLAGSATGTIEGRFFGPVAQEAGAVWTLFDGVRAAIGTIGASGGPPASGGGSGAGDWDY